MAKFFFLAYGDSFSSLRPSYRSRGRNASRLGQAGPFFSVFLYLSFVGNNPPSRVYNLGRCCTRPSVIVLYCMGRILQVSNNGFVRIGKGGRQAGIPEGEG